MPDDRIDSLARSLGMEPIPETTEALRRGIRAELRDLHPDRNGGDFDSMAGRERFAELSDALALIDAVPAATALVPLETVAPMVAAILEGLNKTGHLDGGGTARVAHRETLRRDARREAALRFRVPRYASAGAGVLVTGLWMMPKFVGSSGVSGLATALEASILQPLLLNPVFDTVFFGVALYAWMFFGLTWVMEQNDVTRIDWVTTEEARRSLLKRAVAAATAREGDEVVSKGDLRAIVGRTFKRGIFMRLLGAREVSGSFLDEVVNEHVSELLAGRALSPIEGPALSPRYRVAPEVLRELV